MKIIPYTYKLTQCDVIGMSNMSRNLVLLKKMKEKRSLRERKNVHQSKVRKSIHKRHPIASNLAPC